MSSVFFTFLLMLLILLLLSYPGTAALAVGQALKLCGAQVIPALFPFFVVSSLLLQQPSARFLSLPLVPAVRLCRIQNRQAPLILLLSWLGGYAVCAKAVGTGLKNGSLSPSEARLLLLLGTIASPGFTVGAVGGLLLHNTAIGWMLFAACLCANVLVAFGMSLFVPPQYTDSAPPCGQSAFTLPQAVAAGSYNCLEICGCVVFFRVLLALVTEILPLPDFGQAVLAGLLEVTTGCSLLAGQSGAFAIYGCAGALSLLGGSVCLQIAFLLEGQCSLNALLFSRPLHLALTWVILWGLLRIFPQPLEVYSSLAPRLILSSRTAPDTGFCLFLLCCIALSSKKALPNGRAFR